MKLGIQKVQCVFENENDLSGLKAKTTVMIDDKRGKLHTLTLRGSREEIEGLFRGLKNSLLKCFL